MNKTVILYNENDKTSRDFVETNSAYQKINWYEKSSDLEDYLSLGLPYPSIFPCVVDTELKLIVNNPATMQVALDYFSAYVSSQSTNLAIEIRNNRNTLLSDSDKYMISDYPISVENKALMETYRQSLRDIPDQVGFPSSVEWPVKPV
jgi:hypothetical protein